MTSGHCGLAAWSVERSPAASTVVITGEIDLAVAPQLTAAFDGNLRMDDVVMLDLRDVSFIDSTGLRLLLELKRKIDGSGGAVFLTGVSPAVERVLEVSGMGTFFEHRLPSGSASRSETPHIAG